MSERPVSIFIDGANIYGTTKTLNFDIDFKQLLKYFQETRKEKILRAFYYTTLLESPEAQTIRPLIDWLDYNGYTVVTRLVKEYSDAQGRRKVRGSMDVDLAIDMLEIAPFVGQIYLFSGDGAFCSAVDACQRKGVRVSVISTLEPPMISDDLRRQADEFIDLIDIRRFIQRKDERDQQTKEDPNWKQAIPKSTVKVG